METFFTIGGIQVPLRIDGVPSFGQSVRSIGMKCPVAAGSQLASLSLPGESFWKERVIEPLRLGVVGHRLFVWAEEVQGSMTSAPLSVVLLWRAEASDQ